MQLFSLFTATTPAILALAVGGANAVNKICNSALVIPSKYDDQLRCVAEFLQNGELFYDCQGHSNVPASSEINCMWRGRKIHIKTDHECNWMALRDSNIPKMSTGIQFRVRTRCHAHPKNPSIMETWDVGHAEEKGWLLGMQY